MKVTPAQTHDEGTTLIGLYEGSEHQHNCIERTGGSGKPFETCSWAIEHGFPGAPCHLEVFMRQRLMQNDEEIATNFDDLLPERSSTSDDETEPVDEAEQSDNQQHTIAQTEQQRAESGRFQ